jgi:phosphonatase-like hydrolase
MDNIDLVVFDMAGTTILDTGQVPEAFQKVLGDEGIPVTAADLRGIRGASKRWAARKFVERQFPGPEAEVARRTEQIFEAFREHLSERYKREGVQLISGTLETFSWLRSRGVKIALNTGFDRVLTTLLLQAVGWDKDTVNAVICGDDVTQGRPAPYLIFRAMEAAGAQSVHRVANVGDTTLDLEAGFHAGVRWNIGVLSGAHTKEQMEKVPHTHLISSVAVLPDLWK